MSIIGVLVRVEVDGTGKDNTEAAVDKDISDFDAAFTSLGNDPLVKSEKAIIKTYLAWKLGLVKST